MKADEKGRYGQWQIQTTAVSYYKKTFAKLCGCSATGKLSQVASYPQSLQCSVCLLLTPCSVYSTADPLFLQLHHLAIQSSKALTCRLA
jgi:hypothetical protein